MSSWVGAHILEILVFLATAVEATALVYIYRLERIQFKLQEWRNRVDLRVDIGFPEGYTTGLPSIWIENAGTGSGFIESAELVVKDAGTEGMMWSWRFPMAGRRRLPGLESVRVDLLPALRNLGQKWWRADRSRVEIILWASVLVLVERRDQIRRDSKKYQTSVTSLDGYLSELVAVQRAVPDVD
jgi:hypothetical protein